MAKLTTAQRSLLEQIVTASTGRGRRGLRVSQIESEKALNSLIQKGFAFEHETYFGQSFDPTFVIRPTDEGREAIGV